MHLNKLVLLLEKLNLYSNYALIQYTSSPRPQKLIQVLVKQ